MIGVFMKFTLDELYGSLENYCKHHQMTIDELIEKTQKDIGILQQRYQEIASQKDKYDSDSYEIQLAQARRELIDKKRKHLERLLMWKQEHR